MQFVSLTTTYLLKSRTINIKNALNFNQDITYVGQILNRFYSTGILIKSSDQHKGTRPYSISGEIILLPQDDGDIPARKNEADDLPDDILDDMETARRVAGKSLSWTQQEGIHW